MCQRKQSYTQDNIYVVQQFTYVHGDAEISLLSEKNTKNGAATIFFLCPQKHDSNTHNKTLITKLHSGLGLLAQASAPWTKPQ